MALMVDNGWIGVDDLAAEDTGLLELSQKEGVDLQTKLKLACLDAREELEGFLRRNSVYGLKNAVATWASKRWVSFLAIGHAYRDAYFNQLNDRYGKKWELYSQQARTARDLYFMDGVGVVRTPLRAVMKLATELAPGSQSPRTYWVAATRVSAQGEEGSAGTPHLISATSSHELIVRLGEPLEPGLRWNVYAGAGPLEMQRQNSEPLGAADAWQAPPTGLVEGAPVPEGQEADEKIQARRVLRGWRQQ